MQKNLIIALIFAIIVAIFSIQNSGPVSLVFFTWEFTTSLVVILLASAVLGAIIMWVISSFKQLKLKKEIRDLKKEIRNLDKEVEKIMKEKEEIAKEKESLKEDFVNYKENSSYNKKNNDNLIDENYNEEDENIEKKHNNNE